MIIPRRAASILTSALPGAKLRVMRRVETTLIRNFGDPGTRPVFVIGLPRSGTTLVSQYLAHRLSFCYLTSAAAEKPEIPVLASLMERRRRGQYVSSFQSDYGRPREADGPREAGAVWGRFFSLDDYDTPATVDSVAKRDVAGMVFALSSLAGTPFLNKNVKHLLRLPVLAEIFPRALFIALERDPLALALSVMRGWRELGRGLRDGWWSVKPIGWRDMRDRPLPERVAFQVSSLDDRMRSDLRSLSPENVLPISYEDFCSSPDTLIDAVSMRISVETTSNPSVGAFPATVAAPQTPDEAALEEILGHQG